MDELFVFISFYKHRYVNPISPVITSCTDENSQQLLQLLPFA